MSHDTFEAKILKLSERISAATEVVLHSAPVEHAAAGKLSREVKAMQRLVNAAVSAMKSSRVRSAVETPARHAQPPMPPQQQQRRLSPSDQTNATPSTRQQPVVDVDQMIKRRKDELMAEARTPAR